MKRTIKPAEAGVSVILLALCCGAKLYGIYPFGSAMFVALCPLTFVGMLAPFYILFSFLFTFDVWRLFLSGTVTVIMLLRWVIARKIPRLDKPVAVVATSVAALLCETVLLGVFVPLPAAVVSGAISLAFFCFARSAAGAAMGLFSSKPGPAECLSLACVLFAAGLTFSRAQAGDVNVGIALCFAFTFMLSAVSVKATLGGGVALGAGLAFALEANVGLAFVVAAGAIAAFGKLYRALCGVAAVGVFAACLVVFGETAYSVAMDAIMAAAGCIPYLCIPPRALRAIKGYFDFDGSARLAVRHYINRTRADAGDRLLSLSAIFDETARLLGTISSPEPDAAALGRAMSDKICPYCPNAAACNPVDAAEAFKTIAESACAGRSVISELPEYIAASCPRSAEIVGAAGELSESAKARAAAEASEKNAKAIVVERLSAIKDVLCELGESQALPVGFDVGAEERITAELAARGVSCAQSFVTREGVIAIVRSAAAQKKPIERAVSAALRKKYEIKSLERTQSAGWSVATLKSRPAFEAVYARAGVSKSGGVSGDSYTFKRIGDRFLVALADGMGSGETAGLDSDAAVELIECFYRAGFDSASVLSGVNRFLKLPAAESYSAADVAVCDLDSAAVDIIKLGAPPCYIKTEDTVLKIEGSSLPIGVLDEMRPYVTTKHIYPGQMLLLATDGVADCFAGDELPEYINGLSAVNPERTARAVLERALKRVGNVPRDDMTVIAVRLYEARKRRWEKSA